MKKTALAALLLSIVVSFVSCKNSDAVISGKLIGVSVDKIYLEQSTPAGEKMIDSVALANDGSYRFALKNVAQTPTIYHLVCRNERIPLLVKGGDDIVLNSLGSVLANYTVSGSRESELLHEFNKGYVEGVRTLQQKAVEYGQADEQTKPEIARSYNATYLQIKRDQISFIIANKHTLAAVYVLYQRLAGEMNLVDALTDLTYYRTVADAVEESYPESPYLIKLCNDVARMEAQTSLLQSIKERDYPEIEAFDIYGDKQQLSSLAGQVILVDFWSAELGNSNALNADLKEIYARYADKGFQVFQVSLDTMKATWIKAVQEQDLPWISVCDFCGEKSPIVGNYNVRSLPTNYLIDRDGKIVGRNLYSKALETELAKLL